MAIEPFFRKDKPQVKYLVRVLVREVLTKCFLESFECPVMDGIVAGVFVPLEKSALEWTKALDYLLIR